MSITFSALALEVTGGSILGVFVFGFLAMGLWGGPVPEWICALAYVLFWACVLGIVIGAGMQIGAWVHA